MVLKHIELRGCLLSFLQKLYQAPTTEILSTGLGLLNKAFFQFLWKGKRRHISLAKLCRSNNKGGVQFPDIRLYNMACLLRHALDWINNTSHYSKTNLERKGAHPWHLEAILHTKVSSLPSRLKQRVLYRETVIAWRETLQSLGRSFLFTHYTPIQGNPMFLQGTEQAGFRQWGDKRIAIVLSTVSFRHIHAQDFYRVAWEIRYSSITCVLLSTL